MRYAVLQRLRAARGGYVDGRMRLLDGRRREAHFVQVVKRAAMRKLRLRPKPANDVHALAEMALASGGIHPETAVFVAIDAAPESDVEPPAAERVHSGGVFREPNRVVQSGDEDAGSQPYPLGSGGDEARQRERGRTDPVAREVMLGYPSASETQFLRQNRLIRGARQQLGGVRPLGPGDMCESGVFHGGLSSECLGFGMSLLYTEPLKSKRRAKPRLRASPSS